jgi:hypothetical protein
MQVIYIVCSVVLILLIFTIDLMIKKKRKEIIIRKEVFTPINLGDLPEFARAAFDRVGDVLEKHGLEAGGDFIYQPIKDQYAYLRYFKDKKEEITGYIDLQTSRGIHHVYLVFQTILTGDQKLISSNNIRNPFYEQSPDVYGLFEYPDCMPDELLRLHKEEAAKTRKFVKKDSRPDAFSVRIAAVRQKSTERAIEAGLLIPGENPDELHFSYAAFRRLILSLFKGLFKKPPAYLKEKTYTRGFKKFTGLEQGKLKQLEQTPKETKVMEAKIWWLVLFFVILYLIIFVI